MYCNVTDCEYNNKNGYCIGFDIEIIDGICDTNTNKNQKPKNRYRLIVKGSEYGTYPTLIDVHYTNIEDITKRISRLKRELHNVRSVYIEVIYYDYTKNMQKIIAYKKVGNVKMVWEDKPCT